MPEKSSGIFIGTAGWSIPKSCAAAFPETGTHLERYARRFSGVEINSSFYRSHQHKTYERWAESVPAGFRFAVKVPKQITHERRLRNVDELLERFLGEVNALGSKFGPLLVQLPPSLQFDSSLIHDFLAALRDRFEGDIVCEPRHVSWFKPEAEQTLADYCIARVAADPAIVPQASEPGGWAGKIYHRLHGSPRIYYSSYSQQYLGDLIQKINNQAQQSEVWCIFDNTAEFAATDNALEVFKQLCSETQPALPENQPALPNI